MAELFEMLQICEPKNLEQLMNAPILFREALRNPKSRVQQDICTINRLLGGLKRPKKKNNLDFCIL